MRPRHGVLGRRHDPTGASTRRRSRLVAGAALAAGLLAPALTASATTSGPSGSFPLRLSTAAGAVVVTHRPVRIVSLSPSATEDLFAIGAGGQIVAVDKYSDYPKNDLETNLDGYEPNVEAIVHYSPDLVIVPENIDGLVAALGKVGIPVLLEPAATTIADAYGEIETLGAATGHAAKAAALVATMKAELDAIASGVRLRAAGLTYYYEIEPNGYSATSATFIGQIFSLFSLRNIADRASAASSGYPQLSSEYIVKANPDLIFLADTICCGQSAKTVAERPGWQSIAAVRDGEVVALNDDIASRWGPRIVTLASDIAKALTRLERRHGP